MLFETNSSPNLLISSSIAAKSASVQWPSADNEIANWEEMHETSNLFDNGDSSGGVSDVDIGPKGNIPDRSIRKMNKNGSLDNVGDGSDADHSGDTDSTVIERDHTYDASGSGQSMSKPDLQKQNRLEDVNGSHRLLVILITIFSTALIVFSILLSIAIVLCLVRRKRKITNNNQTPPLQTNDSGNYTNLLN